MFFFQRKKYKILAKVLVCCIIFYFSFESFIFAPPVMAVTAPVVFAATASVLDTTDPTTITVTSTPENALILALAGWDENPVAPNLALSLSNTGGTLNWTEIAERSENDGAYNGQVAAWYAITTSSRSSWTVTADAVGAVHELDLKVYTITKYDTLDPIGAVGEGDSASNNFTAAAYDSTTANSRGFFVALDWNANGSPTSADQEDPFHVAGQISGLEAYKLNPTPTIGTAVTFDVNGGGSSAAKWHWIAVEVNGYGPTFTLNAYRWYVDNDAIQPTDPWGLTDIAQNTAITILPFSNYAPTTTVELRLRVNLTVGVTTLTTSTKRFKLQFKNGTDGDCSTGSWTDVGQNASSTYAWIYATSSVMSGATTTASLLSPASDVLDMYIKSTTSTATTSLNKQNVIIGQELELDFHIMNNSATSSMQNSFRVADVDDSASVTAYTVCPTLTTAPSVSDAMRHGLYFTDGTKGGFYWADE